ncbi:MAG: NTP transferase domain-containing protein [Armatimonadota bacterium]|nr:MAG: NTP transferase domain-containing protein [Armatimonadota bacterium]
MLDAVVLAGGVDRGAIAAETGVVHRPLLEVGGRPMIRRVMAALRGASSVGRVALVAPDPVQAAVGEEAVDVRVAASDTFVDNIRRGVETVAPNSDQVLVLSGDLALITPAAINDFVEQSLAARADVTYPIIPKESCERQFPGARRTYVRLREGTYTGGNGVVLTRHFVASRWHLIEGLYAARKNPVKLAATFGLGFIFGLITGRLSLARIEARAGHIIAGRVAAIISSYAELGFDVDKLEDLNLARQVAPSFDRR